MKQFKTNRIKRFFKKIFRIKPKPWITNYDSEPIKKKSLEDCLKELENSIDKARPGSKV